MNNSPYNDSTEYKALYTNHYHSKGDIKTRKKWNDIYMIDVKSHADFIRVGNDE